MPVRLFSFLFEKKLKITDHIRAKSFQIKKYPTDHFKIIGHTIEVPLARPVIKVSFITV